MPDLTDPSLHVLYTNFPNKVRISSIPKGARVRFQGKYLHPTPVSSVPGSSDFGLVVNKPGKYPLEVILRNKVLYAQEYSTQSWGDWKVRLGNIRAATATKQQILDNPSVVSYLQDCYLKSPVKLLGYTVTVIHVGAALKSIKVGEGNTHINQPLVAENITDFNGVNFSKEVMEQFKRLTASDKILIEDIVAVAPDNYKRLLVPIYVTVR